jgi:cellulose synthase/poly-beta-1,6-N-acetylglucosamine synthase-like glycosyltransferase
MANTIRVTDLDFIFISYREPNANENYADLLNIVPWAKRVHGVKGFDNAHKAAAEKAETDFFISIDGDNRIEPTFLLQTLDWNKTNPAAVHRWRAKNIINGLIYGNGGVVGWPKKTCLGMKTHENAVDEKAKIDFC